MTTGVWLAASSARTRDAVVERRTGGPCAQFGEGAGRHAERRVGGVRKPDVAGGGWVVQLLPTWHGADTQRLAIQHGSGDGRLAAYLEVGQTKETTT